MSGEILDWTYRSFFVMYSLIKYMDMKIVSTASLSFVALFKRRFHHCYPQRRWNGALCCWNTIWKDSDLITCNLANRRLMNKSHFANHDQELESTAAAVRLCEAQRYPRPCDQGLILSSFQSTIGLDQRNPIQKHLSSILQIIFGRDSILPQPREV